MTHEKNSDVTNKQATEKFKIFAQLASAARSASFEEFKGLMEKNNSIIVEDINTPISEIAKPFKPKTWGELFSYKGIFYYWHQVDSYGDKTILDVAASSLGNQGYSDKGAKKFNRSCLGIIDYLFELDGVEPSNDTICSIIDCYWYSKPQKLSSLIDHSKITWEKQHQVAWPFSGIPSKKITFADYLNKHIFFEVEDGTRANKERQKIFKAVIDSPRYPGVKSFLSCNLNKENLSALLNHGSVVNDFEHVEEALFHYSTKAKSENVELFISFFEKHYKKMLPDYNKAFKQACLNGQKANIVVLLRKVDISDTSVWEVFEKNTCSFPQIYIPATTDFFDNSSVYYEDTATDTCSSNETTFFNLVKSLNKIIELDKLPKDKAVAVFKTQVDYYFGWHKFRKDLIRKYSHNERYGIKIEQGYFESLESLVSLIDDPEALSECYEHVKGKLESTITDFSKFQELLVTIDKQKKQDVSIQEEKTEMGMGR